MFRDLGRQSGTRHSERNVALYSLKGFAMSRALNVDATVAHVVALSAKHNAIISAIEPLDPKGTRVVFMNADDAAVVARAYGSRVITGAVVRAPWRQQRVT